MAVSKFGVARGKISSEVDKASASQKEAMNRRLANMSGGFGGGASIKEEREAGRDMSAAELEALASVDAAEAMEAEQKAVRTSEREFGSSEAAAGREFGRGERIGSQSYATSEREGMQDYARSERLGSQEAQKQAQARDLKVKKDALAWQKNIGQLTFDEEKRVNQFNMDMAESMANKKTIFDRMGSYGTQWFKGLGPGAENVRSTYNTPGGSAPYSGGNARTNVAM
jgi:hypothetical protein